MDRGGSNLKVGARPPASWAAVRLLGGALLALLAASPAGAGATISGPAVLAPGERAEYRVTITGDPKSDACDVALSLDLPPGFTLQSTSPPLGRLDPQGGITFAPIATLKAGEETRFDLQLQAPANPAGGAICARLDYGSCPRPPRRDLAAGPECLGVTVAGDGGSGESGGSASDQPPEPAPQNHDIPCGTIEPVVNPGGNAYVDGEWSADARVYNYSTSPTTTLKAKTFGDYLYVAILVDDPQVSPQDAVTFFINANHDGGAPEAIDRSFHVRRDLTPPTEFSGSATGFDQPVLPPQFLAEVAELPGGVGWVAELKIPLTDIGGPLQNQQVRWGLEVRDQGGTSVEPRDFNGRNEGRLDDHDLKLCSNAPCGFITWAQAPDPLDLDRFLNRENLIDDIDGPNGTYARGRWAAGSDEVRVTGFSNGGSTGTVREVEALVHFYLDRTVGNDKLEVTVYWNGVLIMTREVGPPQINPYAGAANAGTLVFDVTAAAHAWAVTDFDPAADLDVRVRAKADGSYDNRSIFVDAVGFRVIVDGGCSYPTGSPDVFVTKDDGLWQVRPGEVLTYEIGYGNRGSATATGVVIVDQLPPNATYLPGSTGAYFPPGVAGAVEWSNDGSSWRNNDNGPTPTWIRLTLPYLVVAPATTYRAAYQVKVAPGAAVGDRVVNDASASAFQADSDPPSDSDADDGPAAGDDQGDLVGLTVASGIRIPCVGFPASIDGVIGGSEYAYAEVVSGTRRGSTDRMDVHLQRDQNFLYVALDIEDDPFVTAAHKAYIAIDVNRNKLDPDAPDRMYELSRTGAVVTYLGTGSAPGGNADGLLWSPAGSGALVARRERTGGWVAEIAIPLRSDLGLTNLDTAAIGLSFYSYSPQRGLLWASVPDLADLNSASTWATGWFDACAPIPDFVYTAACPGSQTTFSDRSLNNPTSWTWDFGDASGTATTQDTTHDYAQGGSYNVTLTACNADGCASRTLAVLIPDRPQPIALPAAVAICVPPTGGVTVPLDGSGSLPAGGIPDPAGYVWTTDLGTIVPPGTGPLATLVIPSGSVPVGQTANGQVRLTLTSNGGCTQDLVIPVAASAPPAAGLVADPTALCGDPSADRTVLLDASATLPPGVNAASWNWLVSVGSVSGTGANVIWTIPAGAASYGTQTADVTVVDDNGCQGAASVAVTVHAPPTAGIVATPARRCTDPLADMVVHLDARGTTPGDGAIQSYAFRAPVGTVSSALAAEADLTLPAGFTGTFDACVDVQDDLGCTATACTTIVIDPPPVARIDLTQSATCRDDLNPIVVGLDGSGSTSGAGIADPAGFAWSANPIAPDQASGALSTLTLPPGFNSTVDVVLIVTDQAGCSATVTRRIDLTGGPTPVLAPLPATLCTDPLAETRIGLDACASAAAAGIDVPGGYLFTVAPPARIDASGCTGALFVPAGHTGTVTVTLTVRDRSGCTASVDDAIEFVAPPLAAFTVDRLEACAVPGQATAFAADASGSTGPGIPDPAGYGWTVDPPSVVLSPAVGSRVTATAPAGFAGPIDLTAIVTDAAGCSGRTTRRLFVHAGPTVAVTATPLEQCSDPAAPVGFDLDATGSTSPDAIASVLFTSVEPSAVIVDTGPGRARVTLPAGFAGVVPVTVTAIDRATCSAVETIELVVHPPPVAALELLGPASVCDRNGTGARFDFDASDTVFLPGPAAAGAFAWTASPGTLVVNPTGDRATVTALPGFTGTITVTLTVRDARGCTASRQTTVEVLAGPSAPTRFADVVWCKAAADRTLTLDASAWTSGSGIVDPAGYAWSAGIHQPFLQSATGRFTTLNVPGNFSGGVDVTVTVTDRLGCVATDDLHLEVRELPRPEIVATPSACGGDVALDGRGSDPVDSLTPIVAYAWSVDPPGTVSPPSGDQTTAIYTVPGTYNATLTVTDAATCSASTTAPFTVLSVAGPTADLVSRLAGTTVPATTFCAAPGLTIELDASGSSGATSYQWWASAGTFSGLGGPIERLTLSAGTSGTIAVRVTVTGPGGCTSSRTIDLVVIEPPQAAATATPPRACDQPGGTSFTLDGNGSVSHHPTDPTLSYEWTTTAAGVSISDPLAAAPTLLASTVGGVSTVVPIRLVVRDAASCPSPPVDLTVTVDPSPAPSIDAVAAVTGRRTTLTSTVTGGTGPFTYAWDFGDGDTSSAPSPTHVFRTAGSYLLRLTVTGAGPCSGSTSREVVVGDVIAGTLDLGQGCAGQPVGLDAVLTGGVEPYLCAWSFDDGQTANAGASTTHVYTAAGVYDVAVTCRDQGNAALTLTGRLTVKATPVVTVTSSGPAAAGIAQTFVASVSAPALVPQWTFSDGATAAGTPVDHVFAVSGPAWATARVTDAASCSGEGRADLVIDAGSTALSLAKVAAPSSASAGGDVEYTLLVSNGAGRVTGLVLADHLPDGFTYRSGTLARDGSPLPDPIGETDLSIGPFDLAADTAMRITYRARIAEGLAAGAYDNSAELRATDAAGDPVYLGPRVATVYVGGAGAGGDLRVRKSAEADPAPAAAGGLVRYRIDYENRGSAAATQVVLRDEWPSALATIEQNDDGGVLVGSRIEWLIPRVAPGGSGSVRYTLRLKADLAEGTAVRNLVTAAALEPDANPKDNQSSADVTIGGFPDLVLGKSVVTAPDPPAPGATATYTLTWRNAGTATAAGAEITDDYDESRLTIEAGPAGGSDEGGVLRIPLGDVAPGASGVVSYTARVKDGAGGPVENHASIASRSGDGVPGNNTASARFDVAVEDARLEVALDLAPSRRCQLPQVEVAMKSDLIDTAAALGAAADFFAAAWRIRAAPGDARDAIAYAATVPPLVSRLETFARLDLESLLLDSRMGILSASGAVVLPFVSTHPPSPARAPGEPWCAHPEHRQLDPGAAGAELSAIAAYAVWAEAAGDVQAQARAPELLAIAAETVAALQSWRDGALGAPLERLPGRVLVGRGPDGAATTAIAASAASVRSEAVLARGLARIAGVSGAAGAPPGLAPAAAKLLALVLADIRAHLAAGEPWSDGAAAIAEAEEAARALSGFDAGRDVAPAVGETPGYDAQADLETNLRRMRVRLARGEGEAARAIWRDLEANDLDPRFRVYRSSPGSAALSYTPATLGSLVAALSRLSEGAPAVDRTALVERMAQTVEKVAIEAGLMGGLDGRAAQGQDLRLLVGSEGGVKVSGQGAAAGSAPVLLGRVSFLAQASHHQDRPRGDAETGIQDDSSPVSYLSGPSGECRTAQVQLVDRGFRSESGLFAADGMEQAALSLRAAARASGDPLLAGLGEELRATAFANRVSFQILAGAGVRLRFAAEDGGAEAEAAVLARYARASGLDAVPAGLFPTWLEFDGGDPVFPEPLDDRAPYGVGWDPARFDAHVSPQGLGRTLGSDVKLAAAAFAPEADPGDAFGRFVGLVRLHAAALKVRLIDRELGERGDVAGFTPVLDAEGRPIDLGAARGAGSARGRAILFESLVAYRALADRLVAPAEAEAPVALAEADRALGKLYPRVLADVAAAGAKADPIALHSAAIGLSGYAALVPGEAAAAQAGSAAAAAALASTAATDDVSPLALQAFALELAARAEGSAGAGASLAALRDRFFDRPWRLFKSGREAGGERGQPGEGFVFTDLDLGALFSALGTALPRLSGADREEATALLQGAGHRLLFETGLERLHRAEVRREGDRIPLLAPQIARSVRIVLSEAAARSGSLYGGDVVATSFVVKNSAAASLATDVDVAVTLPAGLTPVPGSARWNGQAAGDAPDGDVRRYRLGRLGGGESGELTLWLLVDPAAEPGSYGVAARATAKASPAPGAAAIESAPASRTLAVDGFGAIEGRVYVDGDGDGVVGAGDPGLAEAAVQLDDGSVATTDAEGRYRFAGVVPASYTVSLVPASLPGVMAAAGPSDPRIKVRAKDTARLDFGLRAADVITGIVFRDDNDNRRREPDESLVAGVVVETRSGRSAVSDRGGRYLIRGVATGSQELRIGAHQPYVRDRTGLFLQPLALPTGAP